MTRNKPKKNYRTKRITWHSWIVLSCLLCLSCKSRWISNSDPSWGPSFLQKFQDVFIEYLSNLLSPLQDIQHVVDLVLDSSLPNLPHYKINHTEHAELQRQVHKLLYKWFICEILGPRAVLILLTPKKDCSWRMCIDSHAINKSTVKYHFPIPRLDDILDMMIGAIIFSKIDLKSGYNQIRICPGDEWKLHLKWRMVFTSDWSCLLDWQCSKYFYEGFDTNPYAIHGSIHDDILVYSKN